MSKKQKDILWYDFEQPLTTVDVDTKNSKIVILGEEFDYSNIGSLIQDFALLQEYKRIENKLGIKFSLLERVWDNGIYVKVAPMDMVFIESKDIRLKNDKTFAVRFWDATRKRPGYCEFAVDIDKYGETWAFEKNKDWLYL